MPVLVQLARIDTPVRAAFVPVDDVFENRAAELANLAAQPATVGMGIIVTGQKASSDQIESLRRDGVRYCLWDGFSDSEARFVVNRALYDTTRGEVRGRTRVPTELVAPPGA